MAKRLPPRPRQLSFSFPTHQQRVAGARVLDAYSGSGALGFEAISRGAAELVLAEVDLRVLASLRASAATLGIEERCRFVPGRVVEGGGRPRCGRTGAPGPRVAYAGY